MHKNIDNLHKNEKVLKESVLSENNKKELKKMPYKWVKRWVRGHYRRVGRKKIRVRGHYTWVRIWVPRKW
jgi:hypothetical protein